MILWIYVFTGKNMDLCVQTMLGGTKDGQWEKTRKMQSNYTPITSSSFKKITNCTFKDMQIKAIYQEKCTKFPQENSI